MRRLLGKRLHKYLYDQKMAFRKWRVRTKREIGLFALGLPRKLSKTAFLIGPTNSANQGREWTRALIQSGAQAESLRISSDPGAEWFTTDISIAREDWLKFPRRLELARHVAKSKDIVLFESLRPMFRLENIRNGEHQVLEDIDLMQKIGKKVGVIFHGSDIRDVDAHAARSPFSPFRSGKPEIEDLRKRSNENRDILPTLRTKRIPLFVSTLDLLHEIPDAHWLPVVIDFEAFNKVAKSNPVYSGAKLRVLYLPSRSWLKSAELIVPVLEKLQSEGIIEFIYPAPVPHDQIPELLKDADLVIDQYLGVIGVLPIEALAAGRLVMSYVPEDYSHAGVQEIPIISITPDTLESEIRRVAMEKPLPTGGVEFAQKWHDGRMSASVLKKVFRARF